MKYLFCVSGLIGMIACTFSAAIHAIDGDLTGATTWLLAFGLNAIVFIVCMFEIKESQR